MSSDFSICVEPERALIRTRLSGFFALDDVRAFLDAWQEAFPTLRCLPSTHLSLVDISSMKIQSQEVIATFQEMVSASETPARRLAFVVGCTLAANLSKLVALFR
jgi:hypothetical protein